VVDRKRLIAILAAEERIGAMANHLGPADPTKDLRSLLLQARRSSSVPMCLGVRGRDQPHSQTGITATAPIAMLGKTRATSECRWLSNDSPLTRENGNGLAWPRKQRRTQSAEDNLRCDNQNTQGDPFTTAAAKGTTRGAGSERSEESEGRGRQGGGLLDAEGCKYGRNKRCRREDWEAGKDWEGVGCVLGDNAQTGLGKPDPTSTDEANQNAVPDVNGLVAPSPCSLPKLKASKLSCGRDDFDRFGGRETPSVLQRSFLSGGGEKSWKAIEELRRELAITESGLVVLKARVRADVAWVQETVGGRMSRRAREACCKWGSEKIADLTHRWETRLAGDALATWSRHRQYMANRKRGERRRAERIVALKKRRRAATEIQKCVKSFIGHRKALAVGEALLHQRVSVAIQAAWRGLLARREVAEKRRDTEAIRAAKDKAATRIQTVQRRNAAKGAVQTKRKVDALQRRKSAEIAATSIQRVARGKLARASKAKAIASRR
ncbi:unnamed protein product, partial [Hapterophycus canaliculatus]